MKYNILDDVILRTPKLGFNQFYNANLWKEAHTNSFFKEALFIASPDLYYAFSEKGIHNESLKLSLFKYYSRACFRCTPFGLFAGISTCKWGTDTKIELQKEIKSTRLDSECVYKIANKISQIKDIEDKLRFYPNSTYYTISKKLRYIEYDINADRRYYNLPSVGINRQLNQIIKFATNGKTKKELISHLINANTPTEDAISFLNSLIANQILINKLEPEVTGGDFLESAIKILENEKENNETRQLFANVLKLKQTLNKINTTSYISLDLYDEVYKSLDLLNIAYKPNKVFHVDLFKSTAQNTLSFRIKRQLEIALEALVRLASSPKNTPISNFIQRYKERFGDQIMPLLNVLDTDNGIGYTAMIESDANSITDNIDLKKDTSLTIQMSEVSKWLHTKIQKTILNNEISLNLTTNDVNHFTPNYHNLPDTFSIVFRVIDFKNSKLLIESAGGSNGIKLLGRFACANDEIHKIATSISHLEQQNNPSKIIAEIIHVPDNRLANIIMHPPFYPYEIPVIGNSSLPKERQIPLQDLYVCIEDGKVNLLSKTLNKEILPTLSNAHNTFHDELPAYRFLTDLQAQNKISSLTFDLGELYHQMVFIPRITFEDLIVLQPAIWRLHRSEWIELMDKKQDLTASITAFKLKWKLPRYVVLEENDNELFIDFETPDCVLALLKTIKNKDTIILKEFLFDQLTPIQDLNQNKYANQFIATVGKNDVPFQPDKTNPIKKRTSAVKFHPGSEWLYIKYFCSVKLSDSILIQYIKPFVNSLLKSKLIDEWFFIRYKENYSHLRIRLHLSNPKNVGIILKQHSKYFNPTRIETLIWKIQIDTYEREIKRYGTETIKYSERLFFHDSKAVVSFLATLDPENMDNDLRWLWALKSIDDLLESFMYDIHNKILLVESLKNAFKAEFDLPKNSLLEIDKKYRKYYKLILSVFSGECLTRQQSNLLKKRSRQFRIIHNEMKKSTLDVTMDELLKSHIHMSLNRLLQHSQRLQEMIIYDFLYRYYKSKLIRNTQSK